MLQKKSRAVYKSEKLAVFKGGTLDVFHRKRNTFVAKRVIHFHILPNSPVMMPIEQRPTQTENSGETKPPQNTEMEEEALAITGEEKINLPTNEGGDRMIHGGFWSSLCPYGLPR